MLLVGNFNNYRLLPDSLFDEHQLLFQWGMVSIYGYARTDNHVWINLPVSGIHEPLIYISPSDRGYIHMSNVGWRYSTTTGFEINYYNEYQEGQIYVFWLAINALV